MADFKQAFGLTAINEGGYANNPDDIGKETYAGIARKFWPNWNGWIIIDKIKSQHGQSASTINQFASLDTNLQEAISSFYKANFWDQNKLDEFNDQQLANNVYDFGVNSGTSKAAKLLQECLLLPADGIIGNQTLAAVNSSLAKTLYENYNYKRKQFYENLASNPTQHQFLSSWLTRLKTYEA